VGDALIGKQAGSLSLLSAEKYADARAAREGLKRLLKYNFEAILVGDGLSILNGARQPVERALQRLICYDAEEGPIPGSEPSRQRTFLARTLHRSLQLRCEGAGM